MRQVFVVFQDDALVKYRGSSKFHGPNSAKFLVFWRKVSQQG